VGATAERLGVLRSYLASRQHRFTDREELLAWQRPRLVRALRRARTTFPAYHGVAADDLTAFPVIDRQAWLSGFGGLNDRGLSLEECLAAAREAEAGRSFATSLGGASVGLSTGTSGRQGAFLTSPAERSRWAGTLLAKALPGGLRAGARIALVLRAGGPLYAAMGSGRIRFRYIDLYAPPEQQLAELADFAPTVLAAPPVLLDQLATAHIKGRLAISPAAVYSIADVLDPDVATRIQAGFDVRVGQVYQATEGFLGITCAHGTLHLNEDLLVVEREDVGDGRFAPVVTDLFRTTQAIIRYRIGDVLHPAATPCACGSALLAIDRIEGRDDDVLRLARAAGGTGPCFADLVRGLVLGTAGVTDFSLEQDAPDHLLLAVTPQSAWPAAAAGLAAGLAATGFVPPRIGAAEFTAPDPTRKRRRVNRSWR
jgi:putative adenylate-forming enzyme